MRHRTVLTLHQLLLVAAAAGAGAPAAWAAPFPGPAAAGAAARAGDGPAASSLALRADGAARGLSRDGLETLRIPHRPPPEPRFFALADAPSSRIIYLDDCAGGCDIETREDDAGHRVEDAREGYSSILDEDARVPAFPYGDDRFEEIAACVRRIFGPFDIEVTTDDPGDRPHWRHIIGGAPGDLGFAPNVMGVSPYDFESCRPIPNAISFGFPELVGDEPIELCELAAHELGHSLGLDHALDCRDPMTYLEPCGEKAFQDEDLECGEDVARPCHCDERQNSHGLLMDRFGARDAGGVAVDVRSPAAGAHVESGYALELDLDADYPDRVEISLNSGETHTLEPDELVFSPPPGTSEGIHRYAIAGYDQYERRAEVTFSVVRGAPCARRGDCAGYEACVGGRCVPGAAAEGGLGAPCAGDDDCASGRCAIDPDQEFDDTPAGQCVEVCDENAAEAGCPSGFVCRVAPGEASAGDDTVCYAESGGGCAAAPGGPGRAPPATWAIAAMLVFLWRRGARAHRGGAAAARR